MIPTYRPERAPLFPRTLSLLALALGIAGAGCSKVGCFEWTKIEGACPSRAEALPYFDDSQCGGHSVASVDSEPQFDGHYCCYDITKADTSDTPVMEDCAVGGVPPSGGGPVTAPDAGPPPLGVDAGAGAAGPGSADGGL